MYTGNISFIGEFWSNIQAQTDRLLNLMGTNDSLIRIDTVSYACVAIVFVETWTDIRPQSNSKLGSDWDWYDGPRYGAGTK